MYIFRSWRDSLSLLAPANLKLFLLVTLKSTLETYKVLFTRLVPISVMVGIVGVPYVLKVVQPYMQAAIAHGLYLLFLVLQFVFIYLELYVGYAAARPSIGIKNDAYFLRFLRYSCLLTIIPIVLYAEFFLMMFGAYFLMGIVVAESRSYAYALLLLLHCAFNIIILFFLDSDGSFKELWRSVVRAFTMIAYNLPLMGIFFALEIGIVFGYQKLGCYETWWLASVPFLLSVPLINIYTNFYIKKVHEQPDLYFDVPK
jgi:hypothetical protein